MSKEDKSVPPIDGQLLVPFFRVAAAQYTAWRKDLGGVVKSGYEGCNIDTALMVLIHLLPGVRRITLEEALAAVKCPEEYVKASFTRLVKGGAVMLGEAKSYTAAAKVENEVIERWLHLPCAEPVMQDLDRVLRGVRSGLPMRVPLCCISGQQAVRLLCRTGHHAEAYAFVIGIATDGQLRGPNGRHKDTDEGWRDRLFITLSELTPSDWREHPEVHEPSWPTLIALMMNQSTEACLPQLPPPDWWLTVEEERLQKAGIVWVMGYAGLQWGRQDMLERAAAIRGGGDEQIALQATLEWWQSRDTKRLSRLLVYTAEHNDYLASIMHLMIILAYKTGGEKELRAWWHRQTFESARAFGVSYRHLYRPDQFYEDQLPPKWKITGRLCTNMLDKRMILMPGTGALQHADALIHALFVWQIGGRYSDPRLVHGILRVAEECRACGQLFYAACMLDCVIAGRGVSPTLAEDARALRETLPKVWPNLTRYYVDAAVMESNLKRLEGVLRKWETGEAPPDDMPPLHAIRWRVCPKVHGFYPNEPNFRLEFSLAKYNYKKNTLSSGRQLSLTDLTCREVLDTLSSADRALAKKAEYLNAKPRYGSGDESIREMPAEMLTFLQGNPLVTCSDFEGDIEFAIRKPHVYVHTHEDGFELDCTELSTRIQVAQPIGNKLDIITPIDDCEDLVTLVKECGRAGRLMLPRTAMARLEDRMGSLLERVTIQGNLPAVPENVRKVPCDVKIVVLIGREEQGVYVMVTAEPRPEVYELPGGGIPTMAEEEGGVVTLWQRDWKGELEVYQQLLQACPMLAQRVDAGGEAAVPDPAEALALLEELQNQNLAELRWKTNSTLRVSVLNSTNKIRINLQKDSRGWFEVGGNIALDEQHSVGFADLLKSMQSMYHGYVKLNDELYVRLSEDLERQLRGMEILSLGSSVKPGKKADSRVPASALALLSLSMAPEDIPSGLTEVTGQIRAQYDAPVAPPEGVRAELRPYQRAGYEWMQRMLNSGVGICLADDMGLGKTLQVLSVLQMRASDGCSLVVAPASVCAGWKSEAERFTPGLRVHVYGSEGDRAEQLEHLTAGDVLVCSYGLLISDEGQLTKRKWNVVVLDEAQAIKNSETRRAEACYCLKARGRIAATGTPVENRMQELRSIFHFLNPGLLGSEKQFNARFRTPESAATLRRLIAPFVLRRLKQDVLADLPEKTESVLRVQLSPEERALYEVIRQEGLSLKTDGDPKARFRILAILTRLRRLCCASELVATGRNPGSSKIDALMELAEELKESGHKALVFSQFTDVLAIVEKRMKEAGHSYLYLDGSTPRARRAELVKSFQSGQADFFLISLKAGGVGLTLTEADYVILLDPWWNPAVENQAADRSHRIGQKNPVTVYRLVCSDTVEEKVLAIHEEKKALFDTLINDSSNAGPLSPSELIELMR